MTYEMDLRAAAQLHDAGRLDEAVRAYDAVAARHPGRAQPLDDAGIACAQLGRWDEAVRRLEAAVHIDPRAPGPLVNYGAVLLEMGRLHEAVAAFERALAIDADNLAVHFNRGIALKRLGRAAEALAAFDTAIVRAPSHPDLYNHRGAALEDLARLDEALASFERALALAPGHADAWCNRGNALKALGRLDEAIGSYQSAIAHAPGHVTAHQNLAVTLIQMSRWQESAAVHDRLLALAPDLPLAPGRALYSRMAICDWGSHEAQLAALNQQVERREVGVEPLVYAGMNSVLSRHLACAFVEHLALTVGDPLPIPANGPKPRIGYFSTDFGEHAVMRVMAETFEAHDHDRFEFHAFSYGSPRRDPWGERLRAAFPHFHDVGALSDRDIAAFAREQGLDLAVDLNGYTQGVRLGIFAARTAPVQISYLGCPGTLAAPFFDYIVADAIVVPEESLAHYGEKVVFLPGCYQPNGRNVDVSARPLTRTDCGLPERAVVFCSFNHTHKITPEMFGRWMRILGRVPDSVLWLWADDPVARRNLQNEAEVRGIAPDRLIFAEKLPVPDHLSRLRLADLALDTSPYNGHATGSDALRMGVPLITCPSRSFAGRVGASLLSAAGCSDLVAPSFDAYEELAVRLAGDPAARERLRASLLEPRPGDLFDAAAAARKLERAYELVLDRARRGLPPEHIRF